MKKAEAPFGQYYFAVQKNLRGFTFIELVVVIAIIVILITATINVFRYVSGKAARAQMLGEIRLMEAMLEAYKADNGGYPPLDPVQFNGAPVFPKGPGIKTNFDLEQDASGGASGNTFKPARWSTNGWCNIYYVYRALSCGPKIYMTFPTNRLYNCWMGAVSGPGAYPVILDAVGNPYGYSVRNPKYNKSTFDLFSLGVEHRVENFADPLVSPTNYDLVGNWMKN